SRLPPPPPSPLFPYTTLFRSIARALASGRTGTVGILGPSLEDLWQQRFAAEAGRVLLARDHFALIVDPGGDPDRQRMLATQLREIGRASCRERVEMRVDGRVA